MFDKDDQHEEMPRFHVELLDRCASLEERVKEVEAELEHSHRLAMLGTIVGSIAHEINNVLTPVVSYAELARLHPEDAELSRKALERAAAGASQAASIASSILDLVRSPNVADEALSADVAAAIEHTLLCTGQSKGNGAISVVVEVQPGCAAQIEPVALQQVLLNLFLNAERAMERTDVEQSGLRDRQLVLRGSTWNSDANGLRVRIEVEDSGCGMDDVTLAGVFEPFVSRGGASASGRVSTGLGLSTSRQLVERFGGKISARSQVGKGSVFSIDLPAAATAQTRKSA